MAWWLTVPAFAGVVCALAAWWWFPIWQVARFRPEISDPKDRAEVEDNFRKSIGQLIGGAAVIVAAGLAYFQTQQTMLRQEEQTRLAVSSQQISKGFELLGDKESTPLKRVSAIYLLESVMKTADHYNASVLDALSAFVRVSTANNTDQGPPATDVQAALTVIIRHPSRAVIVVLDDARIPRAFLNDADLIGATLAGVRLDDAQLLQVSMSGASLVNARLDRAKLFGAKLDSCNLNGAYLTGAELISANLSGATLYDAKLQKVNLNGANLSKAKLKGANFDEADLSDVLNLSQGQLDEACGTGTKLPGSLTIKPCPEPR